MNWNLICLRMIWRHWIRQKWIWSLFKGFFGAEGIGNIRLELVHWFIERISLLSLCNKNWIVIKWIANHWHFFSIRQVVFRLMCVLLNLAITNLLWFIIILFFRRLFQTWFAETTKHVIWLELFLDCLIWLKRITFYWVLLWRSAEGIIRIESRFLFWIRI